MNKYKIECFHKGMLIFSDRILHINKIDALYEAMPNVCRVIGDRDFIEIKFKIKKIK